MATTTGPGATTSAGPGPTTSAGGPGSTTSGGGAGTTGGSGGQAGSTGMPGCGALGAACSSGDECCAGFCDRGACVAVPGDDGKACRSPGECSSGRCNSGVCGNLTFSLLPGDLCVTGASCKSYSCDKSYCGPRMCAAQGEKCMTDADCCGRSCANGTCAPQGACNGATCVVGGSIGDSPCSKPTECVTGLCTAGHCNREAPECPSGPGSCENCLALNCCDVEAACTATPSCAAFLGCFRRCTRSNGSRAGCVMTCGPDDSGIAQKLVDCGAHRCWGSCN
jgi:hypothetical protein